ncbi:hypothetical protein MTR67_035502, partial [Solanum verrucosum]
ASTFMHRPHMHCINLHYVYDCDLLVLDIKCSLLFIIYIVCSDIAKNCRERRKRSVRDEFPFSIGGPEISSLVDFTYLRLHGNILRAVVGMVMEKLKETWRALLNSRSCLGCCVKPPHVILVDRPSKGQKVQGQRLRKRGSRDDFWSSSACEMENSAFPSQRSVSSISTLNQGLDAHSSSSTTNNTEFVNHGKCIFHSLYFHWLSWEYFTNSNLSWGYPSLTIYPLEKALEAGCYTLSSQLISIVLLSTCFNVLNRTLSGSGLILWSKTREEWIGNRTPQKHTAARESKLSFDASYETLLGTNKPFPQSIPLSEMVDFLVDVWEQEGLYD